MIYPESASYSQGSISRTTTRLTGAIKTTISLSHSHQYQFFLENLIRMWIIP